jgi:carbamate kinase
MGEKCLVALGGNAILKHREVGTAEEQFENIRSTSKILVELIREDYRIAITHGNGPQVGDILLRNELAKATLPPMPLDLCGAESQGMIGYMLQLSMRNELRAAKIGAPVVTLLTQTLVDKNDPAFQNPTKPVGPFYSAMEASKLRREKGWTVINDSGRGYRRVVPSPLPKTIIEGSCIKELFELGVIVIAAGGGGIPVTTDADGNIRGVEAVIDKDHSASVLAQLIGAEVLLILTDVEQVALNYGLRNQKNLRDMTVKQATKYIAQGHFQPGSMKPKIESSIRFVKAGGKRVVITSAILAKEGLSGTAGTTIHP